MRKYFMSDYHITSGPHSVHVTREQDVSRMDIERAHKVIRNWFVDGSAELSYPICDAHISKVKCDLYASGYYKGQMGYFLVHSILF